MYFHAVFNRHESLLRKKGRFFLDTESCRNIVCCDIVKSCFIFTFTFLEIYIYIYYAALQILRISLPLSDTFEIDHHSPPRVPISSPRSSLVAIFARKLRPTTTARSFGAGTNWFHTRDFSSDEGVTTE